MCMVSFFFFFKQKTAYEMRISDWSSDVCSSDLLDWELSTLGHPLADFAYNAVMYHMPPHIVAGLGGADLAALNIPSEADYIAAYCARTGRASIDRKSVV